MEYHKGQICFPGGSRHAEDVSLQETALRESYEEVGIRPEDVEILGELDSMGTLTSNFLITPFVGIIPYPYKFTISTHEIDELIEVPLSALAEDVLGVLCPHAGYNFSGAVAGAAISRVKFKDTFVILGPNHTGLGQPCSIMVEGTWRTPLGDMEIDSELAQTILGSSSYLQKDEKAHMEEHSIEVQLPFLQYFKEDVKFVPIVLMGDAAGDVYKDIGKGIAKVIKESDKKVVIMASSDMSHYETQATAKENDFKAIEAILALDPDELLKRVKDHHITMCGYAPVATMIHACKELGAKKAELVMYQTSGDVTGDFHRVVGYASVIIKK